MSAIMQGRPFGKGCGCGRGLVAEGSGVCAVMGGDKDV